MPSRSPQRCPLVCSWRGDSVMLLAGGNSSCPFVAPASVGGRGLAEKLRVVVECNGALG